MDSEDENVDRNDADHDAVMQLLEEKLAFDEEMMDVFFGGSSDEEEEEEANKRKGKMENKDRDFASACAKITKDYFNGRESTYSEGDFERRFRMSRRLYIRVEQAVMGKDRFVQKTDCTKKLGIHPLVKIVACFRFLAYGDAYDWEDENLRLSESSMRGLVRVFTRMVVHEFGPLYLNRVPTKAERRELSRRNARRGFPGMIASLMGLQALYLAELPYALGWTVRWSWNGQNSDHGSNCR